MSGSRKENRALFITILISNIRKAYQYSSKNHINRCRGGLFNTDFRQTNYIKTQKRTS